MSVHSEKEGDLFSNLQSSRKGLSSAEAKSFLEKYGKNEITQKNKISPWQIFFSQFNSFLVYILIFASIVSVIIGYVEHDPDSYIDAGAIFVIVILNAVLGFVQEYRAESSLEALKKLMTQKVTILRDGRQNSIDSREIVPGDIMIIEAGDKIAADGRVIEQIGLKIQESSLTGESTSVGKKPGVLPESAALADRTNMVFSGTTAVVGKGTILVTSTAMKTELGKIANLIQEAVVEPTPLQKRLEDLGKMLGIMTIFICVVVFIIGALRSGDWIGMFLVSISLAVAAVPEGLPAVITIALALGMQRMIKRNALIRKLPSVEALGSVTVICSDKTGTLTKNEMTVRKIYFDSKITEIEGAGYSPSPKIQLKDTLLLKAGILCNNAELYNEGGQWKIHGDPTEAALLVSAAKSGIGLDEIKQTAKRIHEILFDSERKRMTAVNQEGKKKIAYAKGAPNIIVELCSSIYSAGKVRKITVADKKRILEINDKMSSEALRILAFAYRDVTKLKDLDKSEKDLVFIGLQGMIDPPRAEVKPAIEKCKMAGIRVVMITGDYIGTAKAIAKELGMDGKAITGDELEKINLENEVENISIYARVNPEHKTRIVQALKKKGHIVAMTGDGVNDAPALKNADIGVAMGIAGTDVAKEASAMVLTDDNFASIVNAIEEGRGIYDNIRKFVFFLLAANIAEVMLLFIALLLNFTTPDGRIAIPLIAIQLLWINIVTDGIPALALGVDPPDPKIMQRAPRPPKQHVISKDLLINILLVGIVQTVLSLLLFRYFLPHGIENAQTAVLTFIVIFEIGVIAALTRHYFGTPFFSNKYFFIAVGFSAVLQLAVLLTPLRTIFKLDPLTGGEWIIILGVSAIAGMIMVPLMEIVKKITKSDLVANKNVL